MRQSDAAIVLRDVTLRYPLGRGLSAKRWCDLVRRRLLGRRSAQESGCVTALNNVSLWASAGDVVGIVGHNGAGKTTLAQIVAGVLLPDSGSVRVTGRVCTVFNLGAGFIPALTGRENIHLVGSLQGLSSRQVVSIEAEVIEFAGLREVIDRPLKTYSTGMRARLGFAIVSFLDTEIVVLDEALGAGDIAFRRKAGNLIERFSESRKTLVVVSHSTRAVRSYCTVAYCLRAGRIVESGTPERVCGFYESLADEVRSQPS